MSKGYINAKIDRNLNGLKLLSPPIFVTIMDIHKVLNLRAYFPDLLGFGVSRQYFRVQKIPFRQ
ncbi:hypothetical protein BpHYR1_037608 [Brachionus plicatilis]|uniref:Uncharacterized protein n=1 Tax=Brachionus plicatilis TaxID=10195 RepID=A0A3M7S146_BRAPC|nr:hypothetical protein BpHYR1_037608 [Brachionus plicatilis]